MDDSFDHEFWASLLRGDHFDRFLENAAPSGKPPVPDEVFAEWRRKAKEAADRVREHLDRAMPD